MGGTLTLFNYFDLKSSITHHTSSIIFCIFAPLNQIYYEENNSYLFTLADAFADFV